MFNKGELPLFLLLGTEALEMFQNPPSGEPHGEKHCSDSGHLGKEGGLKVQANEQKLAAMAQGTADRKWTYWVLTAHRAAILAFLPRMLTKTTPPTSFAARGNQEEAGRSCCETSGKFLTRNRAG